MREIKIIDEKKPGYGRKFALKIRWDKNHCESTSFTKEELLFIAKLVQEKFDIKEQEYVELTENDITRPGDEIKWKLCERYMKCQGSEIGCMVKNIDLQGIKVRRPIYRCGLI